MKHSIAFALIVFLFPTLAWGCFYKLPPIISALDFLILGVAVGTGFRLFIEPLTTMSRQLGAAVFLSSLFASLGVGFFAAHNPGWGFDLYAVGALILAPFGVAYPKNRFLRVLVLGSTFCIACYAVILLEDDWRRSGAPVTPVPVRELNTTVTF